MRAFVILMMSCALLGGLGLGSTRAADDGGTRSVFAEGAGNRALAMGSAYVAVADDASAIMWNPAGLGIVPRRQLQASHTNLFGLGFSEQYAAFALPSWRWGTAGIALRSFGVGGIEVRDDRNLLVDDNLKDSQTEVSLGYGRHIGDAWSVGGAVKLQRQSLAGYSDSGIGLDLGLLVRPALAMGMDLDPTHDLRFGMSVRNLLEPTIRLDQEEVRDPTGFRMGLSYDRALGERGSVVAALDVEKTADMGTRLHAGLEVVIVPSMALRAGMNAGAVEAGVGARWRDLSVDYVYEDNPLGAIHRFGLTFTFGKTTLESRQSHLAAEEQRLQDRMAQAFEARNRSRIDDLLDQASREMEAGSWDAALATVARVEVLAPDNTETQDLEAQCLRGKGADLLEAGDLAGAAVVLGQVLNENSRDRKAAKLMVLVRRESDRRSARTTEIRDAFNRALDAFVVDDLPTARQGFAWITSIDPTDTEATAMLQRTEAAITRRTNDLIRQAGTLIDRGWLLEAETAIRTAELVSEGRADVDQVQARLDAAEAARARARAAAEIAATMSPDPSSDSPDDDSGGVSDAAELSVPAPVALTAEQRRELEDLYHRGVAYMESGRADEAIRYWEFVWSVDPTYGQVTDHLKREYLTRGMESFAAGELHAAAADWERAVEIDPTDERALGYLDRARNQLARYERIVGSTRVAMKE